MCFITTTTTTKVNRVILHGPRWEMPQLHWFGSCIRERCVCFDGFDILQAKLFSPLFPSNDSNTIFLADVCLWAGISSPRPSWFYGSIRWLHHPLLTGWIFIFSLIKRKAIDSLITGRLTVNNASVLLETHHVLFYCWMKCCMLFCKKKKKKEKKLGQNNEALCISIITKKYFLPIVCLDSNCQSE